MKTSVDESGSWCETDASVLTTDQIGRYFDQRQPGASDNGKLRHVAGSSCAFVDIRRAGAQVSRIMGDKSPKANQKQSKQKQGKVNSAAQKKNTAAAAKQVAKGKK